MKTIKQIRWERRLKACQLAKNSGVCVSSMSRIENGWIKPNPHTKQKIADALGMTVDQIIWETA